MKTIPRKQLVIGKFYTFQVKLPALRHNKIPAATFTDYGQLIDKRSNGELIFQVEKKVWDIPASLTPGAHLIMTDVQMLKKYKRPKRSKIVFKLVATRGAVITQEDLRLVA